MGDGWQHLQHMIGAIAPVFILIAIGRLIIWKRLISEASIGDLTRLLYWVCLPAMLIDRLGRDLPPAGSVVKASIIGVIATSR